MVRPGSCRQSLISAGGQGDRKGGDRGRRDGGMREVAGQQDREDG